MFSISKRTKNQSMDDSGMTCHVWQLHMKFVKALSNNWSWNHFAHNGWKHYGNLALWQPFWLSNVGMFGVFASSIYVQRTHEDCFLTLGSLLIMASYVFIFKFYIWILINRMFKLKCLSSSITLNLS